MSNASKKNPEKIMVFGVFDGLHPGHLNFFRQARALARRPYLVVSVARDRNVIRLKERKPNLGEKKRMALLKKCKLAEKVVLSGIKNHLPHILKIKPDIIALGYDQKAYVRNLKKDLKNKGLLVRIIRLKPYKKNIYKSSLLYRTSSSRSETKSPKRSIAPKTKKRYSKDGNSRSSGVARSGARMKESGAVFRKNAVS